MKFTCPACKVVSEINIGSLMGKVQSAAKTEAARRNARLPRGPRKKKPETIQDLAERGRLIEAMLRDRTENVPATFDDAPQKPRGKRKKKATK